MEVSQLYEEYKAQFIQNCQNLVLSDQIRFLGILKINSGKLAFVKAYCDIDEHLGIQEIIRTQISSIINIKQIKPQKDKFLVLKKKYEIQKSKKTVQNQDYSNQNCNKQLQQCQKLNECKSLLYQMEDNSINISQNLKDQTEKMGGMKQKLGSIGQIMTKANNLVDTMLSRQRRRQSIVTMVLIASILTIFAIKYCCI